MNDQRVSRASRSMPNSGVRDGRLHTVAIYSRTYLTMSMTFVYRQLTGIEKWFDAVVLTSDLANPDLFPFSPVYEGRPPADLVRRIRSKIYRSIKREYCYTADSQFNLWLNACRAHHVSLIHAHFGYGGIQMLPLAEALKVPLLVTFHGTDASYLLRNRSYRSSLRRLFGQAHVLCVSEAMRASLSAFKPVPKMLATHYIGVPVASFPFRPRPPLSTKIRAKARIEFLQVSNLIEVKGHRYTLRAFREFLRSYPNAHLTLAGDGELRKQLMALVRALGLTNQITFLGAVPHSEVVTLMQKADVFLHHSVNTASGFREGLPTVIMEAMSTGLPVISTWHSAIPEVIKDGVNGFLVAERDVAAYATTMLDCLERSDQIGTRAHETITSKFDMNVQNAALARIYSAVIDGYPMVP